MCVLMVHYKSLASHSFCIHTAIRYRSIANLTRIKHKINKNENVITGGKKTHVSMSFEVRGTYLLVVILRHFEACKLAYSTFQLYSSITLRKCLIHLMSPHHHISSLSKSGNSHSAWIYFFTHLLIKFTPSKC